MTGEKYEEPAFELLELNSEKTGSDLHSPDVEWTSMVWFPELIFVVSKSMCHINGVRAPISLGVAEYVVSSHSPHQFGTQPCLRSACPKECPVTFNKPFSDWLVLIRWFCRLGSITESFQIPSRIWRVRPKQGRPPSHANSRFQYGSISGALASPRLSDVCFRISLICKGVRFSFASQIRATIPVTAGAAYDVPLPAPSVCVA